MKFAIPTGIAAVAATAALAQALPQQGAAPFAKGHHRMMTNESRADVQAHVAKMFAKFDTNHDGFLSQQEMEARRAQREAAQASRPHRDPNRMFDRLDVNHDGKVTRAEADAAHAAMLARRAAKGAPMPAQAQGKRFDRLFALADANKDGVITKAEFDAGAAQMHARFEQAAERRGEGTFERADLNHDQRVSQAEMQQMALQHFDRADLNHDGTLTPQERQQSRQAMRAARHHS